MFTEERPGRKEETMKVMYDNFYVATPQLFVVITGMKKETYRKPRGWPKTKADIIYLLYMLNYTPKSKLICFLLYRFSGCARSIVELAPKVWLALRVRIQAENVTPGIIYMYVLDLLFPALTKFKRVYATLWAIIIFNSTLSDR